MLLKNEINTVKLGVGELFYNRILLLVLHTVYSHVLFTNTKFIFKKDWLNHTHTNTKFDCIGQGATLTSESPAPLPIFGYQNSGFIEDELDRF